MNDIACGTSLIAETKRLTESLMTTITIQEAQAKLLELIHRLTPGEEVLITENDQPVARLLPTTGAKPQRKLGTMRGTVLYVAPDFDAPLDDFKEYTQ
jgi:antitoxin (DNA-binding transcriptional repressor) of toxin-antitoxin stability system